MIPIASLAVTLCAYSLIGPLGLASQELPVAATQFVLPNGTPVKLQSMRTISSAHAHKGDRLEFEVVEDVIVGGSSVIRAGALARGSVVAVKGKRPFGMGGNIIVKLDSVELVTGDSIALTARQEFKGKSHTIRMAVGMAITAAFYLPATPVLLLSRGRDSTVLKGAEITAYSKTDSLLEVRNLAVAPEKISALNNILKLLPPRVMNGEGRQGDMLNLIFIAREDALQEAFSHAGWLKVERSKPLIFWHLLRQRKHYTKLPMDHLYVFGRPQDFSYSLPDPKSVVARRHHLRIWRTDRVVDGVPVWVGAATHDIGIEFVKRKFRLFHTIDPDVDLEREFVAGNLGEAQHVSHEEYVRCAEPVFRAQTATGQPYYSDSRLLLLELTQRAAPGEGATEIAGALQSTDR